MLLLCARSCRDSPVKWCSISPVPKPLECKGISAALGSYRRPASAGGSSETPPYCSLRYQGGRVVAFPNASSWWCGRHFLCLDLLNTSLWLYVCPYKFRPSNVMCMYIRRKEKYTVALLACPKPAGVPNNAAQHAGLGTFIKVVPPLWAGHNLLPI